MLFILINIMIVALNVLNSRIIFSTYISILTKCVLCSFSIGVTK